MLTRRQTAFVTAAMIAAFTNAADARQTNDPHAIGAAYYSPQYQIKKHPGPGRYKKAVKTRKTAGRPAKVRHAANPAPANIFGAYYEATLPKGNVSLNGVVPPLAAKVREIVSVCGSRVISARRHTYIAGTRRISLHATGQAVDIKGNPSCIYARLSNWPGGYSTDYARVQHVHISHSAGGREWGSRFAHYTGRKARRIRVAAR